VSLKVWLVLGKWSFSIMLGLGGPTCSEIYFAMLYSLRRMGLLAYIPCLSALITPGGL